MAKARRPLVLTSPAMQGPDVRSIQKAINAQLAHLKVDYRITVDGRFGPQTMGAAREIAYMMGAGANNRKAARSGRLTINAQRLIRGRKKSGAEKRRTVARTGWRKKWRKRAQARVSRKPKIVTAAQMGIYPEAKYGGMGTPTMTTGHHSAGPMDQSDSHAIALLQSYDRQHRAQGWGGLGYHLAIGRSGTLFGGRPMLQKGVHTANYNTANVGILVLGTTGDKPTAAQYRTLKWVRDNAHTSKMPAAHRSPVPLKFQIKGHKERPGQATACPGTFLSFYHSGGSK